MSAETKATARPWRVSAWSDGGWLNKPSICKDGLTIAITHPCPATPFQECQVNAELITRSVNSHEALVEACIAALDALSSPPYACGAEKEIQQLEAALALAGEKA